MSSDDLNDILDHNFRNAGYRFDSDGKPVAPREVFELVNGIVVDLFESLGIDFVHVVGED